MTLSQPAPPATDPYAEFAAFYDDYVAHPDYARWVARLIDLAREAQLPSGAVLDIGCGTGLSSIALQQAHPVTIVACEPCEPMRLIAQDRLGSQCEVTAWPAEDIPATGDFAAAFMLNDVVNCLASAGALRTSLARAAGALASGGLLVFDANTLRTYQRTFAQRAEKAGRLARYVWHGLTSPRCEQGVLAVAELTTTPYAGPQWVSAHRQRHHPHARVMTGLDEAGLELTRVFGQDADGHLCAAADHRRDTKWIYVARKS